MYSNSLSGKVEDVRSQAQERRNTDVSDQTSRANMNRNGGGESFEGGAGI